MPYICSVKWRRSAGLTRSARHSTSFIVRAIAKAGARDRVEQSTYCTGKTADNIDAGDEAES